MWDKIWIFQMMGMRWGNKASCTFWVRNHLIEVQIGEFLFFFFPFKKTLCMKRYILSNMICVSCLELSAQIISNSSEEKAFLSSQNSRLDEYKWACKRLELRTGYTLRAGDLLRLSFVAEGCSKPPLAYVLFALSGWRAMARWGSLQSRFCLW